MIFVQEEKEKMRPIDADELKKKLADELSDALGETDFTDGLQHGLKLAIELAEETPIADAEPIRHGHWEKSKDDNDRWRCSRCGNVYIGFNGIHSTFAEICYYCPNCGAKMDDEVEEDE